MLLDRISNTTFRYKDILELESGYELSGTA